jgi:hypothetical protein
MDSFTEETSCNLIAYAIITGFGWNVLNSSEICFDGNYVKTVTISSTIFVGVYVALFIAIRYLIQISRLVSYQKIITKIGTIVTFVNTMLALAWFLWGIVTLSQRACSSDTNHWKFSLGVVIYFGIFFVFSCCKIFTRRKMIACRELIDDPSNL